MTGLVKADRLDKEKFLNEVLKLQSDLLQITDYKSLLTQIEGLLQSSPLFDKVEVISSDIGKEKPIPLRANDHVFSVENENVVSKFKVRAINLTQFQEYLPYFDNLFQFVRKLIDQRQNIIFKYMPNSFINIFKGSDLHIIIFNMETYQINDANEQACKLYGFTLKELKAKLICDLFTLSPKDPKKKKPTLKPPANGITQSVRADGTIMDVLVRINDFVADDNNYGFMIVEDITQYLKLQKEQQRIYNYIDRTKRFESLRFLLRGAAHDFNNYLSAIIGFTELSILELGGDFPEITANLTEIEKASHNCKELVKSILRFGKHDEEMKGMFNLIDLIKDVVLMIKSGIRKTINSNSSTII